MSNFKIKVFSFKDEYFDKWNDDYFFTIETDDILYEAKLNYVLAVGGTFDYFPQNVIPYTLTLVSDDL